MQELCVDAVSKEVVFITEHAYKRIRKRNGWSKKTINRMIARIYVNGLRPDDVKGYKKKWIIHKTSRDEKNDEYVLYGDYIYIFNNRVLLTSYSLPCKERVLKRYKT